MSTGRGRVRERAETPVTRALAPAGANPGRSERKFSSPAPTVPSPATPTRHSDFEVMTRAALPGIAPRGEPLVVRRRPYSTGI